MHELGVVFHIIDDLDKVAKDNGVKRIEKVVLQLGEVSSVIPSYLSNCWRWAADKHDFLRGAELEIETIEAITHCENCGGDYRTIDYAKKCPYCKSEDTWLLQGNEFMIKEIEVPDI